MSVRHEKKPVLKHFIFLEHTDSTSLRLKEGGHPGGTVIVAAEQKTGRGKHGAAWVSPKGGLWFSYILKKKIKRPYYLVALSAAAVALSLEKLGLKPEIKWPNDILLGGKKVCGILLENDYFSGRVITGIGINVNNAPPEGAGLNAISVRAVLGRETDIGGLFRDIVKTLNRFLSGGKRSRDRAVAAWISRQKNMEGRVIRVSGGKTARVVGILKTGKIRVETADGKLKNLPGESFFN